MVAVELSNPAPFYDWGETVSPVQSLCTRPRKGTFVYIGGDQVRLKFAP